MAVKTREQWLNQAVTSLRPAFKRAGVDVPEVRVSVGWPGGRGNKQGVIGQCWMSHAVADGKPAIFISPVLSEQKPERILDVLVHELIHAAGNPGHRGGFVKAGKALGLVEPWTATSASDPLKDQLLKLAKKLGPFGHATISAGHGLLGAGPGPEQPPVQSTRMLKVVCEEDGYTIRTTRKWLAVGNPSCPDGHEMREAE